MSHTLNDWEYKGKGNAWCQEETPGSLFRLKAPWSCGVRQPLILRAVLRSSTPVFINLGPDESIILAWASWLIIKIFKGAVICKEESHKSWQNHPPKQHGKILSQIQQCYK